MAFLAQKSSYVKISLQKIYKNCICVMFFIELVCFVHVVSIILRTKVVLYEEHNQKDLPTRA